MQSIRHGVRLVHVVAATILAFVAVRSIIAIPGSDPQGARSAEDRPIRVAVDERVELLTLVARLAGNREFTMDNSRSPYSERLEQHFAPFRTHPAIDAYRDLRMQFGPSFDAVPSLAVHLGPLPDLVERIPLDLPPERLDRRWPLAETRAFLEKLRDFARITNATEVFAKERPFFDAAAARLEATIAGADLLPWFASFFDPPEGADQAGASTARSSDVRVVVIPGLLAGGGNYGVGVRFPDVRDGVREEMTPVLGASRWDKGGLPAYPPETVPLLVHEIAHSYTNRIVDAHRDRLLPLGERLYPMVAREMERQAYGTPTTLLYETFVRAVVVRFIREQSGDGAAKAAAERESRFGFPWVAALEASLAEYRNSRDRFPTLDAFVPVLVERLQAETERLERANEARLAKAPRVVSITPANGAEGIAPGEHTIEIVFDRPMKTDRWSFVGATTDVPAFVGQPVFDQGRTKLSVRATFEPGRSYRFWLNSGQFQGFASADGIPLATVEVRWSVAMPDGSRPASTPGAASAAGAPGGLP
jgi:hypothetical protein